MSKYEEFEVIKQKIIDNNEKEFGKELRMRYGDDMIEISNEKLKKADEEKYRKIEDLSENINNTLKEACEIGEPSSEIAQIACDLHRQWLVEFWSDYSKQSHLNLAKMYVEDPRFKKYYDNICEGCADFLYEAMKIYCM